MKILTYIVPKHLEDNDFVKSIHSKYTKSGVLTVNQINAIQDVIGIELDFYDYEYIPHEDYTVDYSMLRDKLKNNKFTTAKGKNRVVRALNSIIENKPNQNLIDEALGRIQFYNKGWR